MRTTGSGAAAFPVLLSLSMLAGGCGKPAQQQTTTTPQESPQTASGASPSAPSAPPAAPAPLQQQATATSPYNGATGTPAGSAAGYAPAPSAPRPEAYTLPIGTHLRVTTQEDLGSKISQSGQTFGATVSAPVVVRGVTLVRSGASATGTVVDAKALGHFAGGARLVLRLDTIRADGRTYEVDTSSIDRVEKGKGKRSAILTGGGGGLGALIGGLAGGGKGALIGGLAGAGAGGAGSVFTGNKEIVIPAETYLTFRLERPVRVSTGR